MRFALGKSMLKKEPPDRTYDGGEADQAKNDLENGAGEFHGEDQGNQAHRGNYQHRVAAS